jgi:hypothetical protein
MVVKMTVQRRDESGETVFDTTVSTIDQVLGKRAVCSYEQTLQGYIARRIDSFLSPKAMSQALSDATAPALENRKAHSLVSDTKYIGMVVKSSSANRQRIATELAANPDVIAPLDLEKIVRFYSVVCFGAEREALDLLGTWMTVHSDLSSELVSERGHSRSLHWGKERKGQGKERKGQAMRIDKRAAKALAGVELQSIQEKLAASAAVWLQKTELSTSLTTEEVGFIVSRGLAKIDASLRAALAATWILTPGAMSRYGGQ